MSESVEKQASVPLGTTAEQGIGKTKPVTGVIEMSFIEYSNMHYQILTKQIEGVEKQIVSLEKEMNTKFEAVNQRIDGLEKNMDIKFENMAIKIDKYNRTLTILIPLAAIALPIIINKIILYMGW